MIEIFFLLTKIIVSYIIGSVVGQICRYAIGIGKGLILLSTLVLIVLITGWIIDLSIIIPLVIGFVLGIFAKRPEDPPLDDYLRYDSRSGCDGGTEVRIRY